MIDLDPNATPSEDHGTEDNASEDKLHTPYVKGKKKKKATDSGDSERAVPNEILFKDEEDIEAAKAERDEFTLLGYLQKIVNVFKDNNIKDDRPIADEEDDEWYDLLAKLENPILANSEDENEDENNESEDENETESDSNEEDEIDWFFEDDAEKDQEEEQEDEEDLDFFDELFDPFCEKKEPRSRFLKKPSQESYLLDEFTSEELNDLKEAELPSELREIFDEEIKKIESATLKGTVLDTYGTDITFLAKNGDLPLAVGRDKELAQIYEILARRQKNNPVLIGEAGVGKTAVIELFAQKIANNQVPFIFLDRKIVSIDLAAIIAGSSYRGEFEERFQNIMKEAFAQPNVILFFDEIHTLVGGGASSGQMDAGNLLKPMLARGGFQCMGATTLQEYSVIEKDPALNRRFQTVKVNEPSIEETIQIIYGLRNTLESYHNVSFAPGAIQLAVELSARHIHDRFLPDKAIDFLDRAAARQVVKETKAIDGDILSTFIKTTLIHISQLKNEAYRRGDIATEYVFQEVINTYQNFFLTWLEDPLSMRPVEEYLSEPSNIEEQPEAEFTKEEKRSLSSLSAELMVYMQTVITARTSDLLFASSVTPATSTEKPRHLSSKENEERYLEILRKAASPDRVLSAYDLSLIVYTTWFRKVDLYNSLQSNPFTDQEGNSVQRQFCALSLKNELLSLHGKRIAHSDEKVFGLSEKDEIRFKTMYELFSILRPLIRKALIESLAESAEIKFTPRELESVYNLLGLSATTKEERAFVSSKLNEPSILLKEKGERDFTVQKGKVTPENVRELMTELTGIPLQSLSVNESKKLINLEATLHERVMGQDEAVVAIAKAIRRSRLGIQNPNRPLASFLFCGPTGVGKTEVTKAIATALFGSEKEMVRFDMSEFMEKFAVSRLIGSPPGYVGYEEGGQLTNAVCKKPYCVVLFDEVEKASADVLNILLQVLDDGRLTDSQKRLVLFDNTVIIMTSNIGAGEIQDTIKEAHAKYPELREDFLISEEKKEKKEEKNFSEEEGNEELRPEVNEDYAGVIHFLKGSKAPDFFGELREEMQKEFKKSIKFPETAGIEFERHFPEKEMSKKEKAEKELRNALKEAVTVQLSEKFLPEFINRLDDIIVFQPLKKEELRKICDVMITGIVNRLKPKHVELTVSKPARIKLTLEGYSPEFGARPLRRLLTKYVEDLVSDILLDNVSIPTTDDILYIHIDLDKKGNYIAKTDLVAS